MRASRSRLRRLGGLGLWALVEAAGGCDRLAGPWRTGADAADADAGSDAARDAGVELPTGGRCGPGTTTESTSDAGITGDPACAAGAGELAFSPARPLGLGYPVGADPFPPLTAYLTFDDGPSDWTGEFLDILASEGVRATFFVNARNLKGPAGLDGTYLDAGGGTAVYRDVLRRTADGGHVIGNHTADHRDLATLSAADAEAQLDENERLVNAALLRAGAAPRLLTVVRPPFGSPWYHHEPVPPDQAAAEDAVGRLVAARGLNVMWTIDSSDSAEWAQGESFSRQPGKITPAAGAPTYADKIARIETTVLTDPAITSGSGAVILFHDTHNATRDALRAVIDGLRAAGYTFGTLEEYASWRWARRSAELTPGPDLYDRCTPERSWGCASFASSTGPDPTTPEVCGRMWRAYATLGGAAALGAPVAPWVPTTSGTPSQPFQNATVELHPELAAPCDVVTIPR